ncbi:MAG: prepilin-type N-terminal cleavage/methylation domain-containing protein [Acidobacteria bacterium]|nr:prepilin-type N-terminal cleavage/methylation domain-containing protein [Acidobacteriota bacterium]
MQRVRTSQSGFSMVEMLMAAFILAVGILGLSMLQLMSMRAARGSRSLTTAVQIADHIMDRLELEGRLSYLTLTDTALAAPAAMGTLNYITQPTVTRLFNKDGVDVASVPPPADVTPIFTVTTTLVAGVNNIPVRNAAGAQIGLMGFDDYQVVVRFEDELAAGTATKVQRTVNLTRRILHG